MQTKCANYRIFEQLTKPQKPTAKLIVPKSIFKKKFKQKRFKKLKEPFKKFVIKSSRAIQKPKDNSKIPTNRNLIESGVMNRSRSSRDNNLQNHNAQACMYADPHARAFSARDSYKSKPTYSSFKYYRQSTHDLYRSQDNSMSKPDIVSNSSQDNYTDKFKYGSHNASVQVPNCRYAKAKTKVEKCKSHMHSCKATPPFLTKPTPAN